MNNLNSLLERFGLEDKESGLYLASLSIGESNMTDLAKKASLKRPTAYLAFKSLEQKGLMGSFKARNGLRFVATEPNTLLKKAEHQLEEIKILLPQLKALTKSSGTKPKIRYFEGKEGYIVATEESLKDPSVTIRHIGSIDDIHKVIGLDYDLKHYLPTRIKMNIAFKALYFDSKNVKDRSHAEELREIKYLPEKHKFKTSTLIYGNKIAIFSTKEELITVIIESKDIAEGEREKFDLLWDLIKA